MSENWFETMLSDEEIARILDVAINEEKSALAAKRDVAKVQAKVTGDIAYKAGQRSVVKWIKSDNIELWEKWTEELYGWKVHKLDMDTKLKEWGIIIVDSVCIPLRQGAIGNAIGYSGFRGIVDKIGQNDLYGKALKVTKVNIADSLATAANLIMGEADESTPVALISDYGAEFTNETISETEIVMDADKCIFKGLYPNNK